MQSSIHLEWNFRIAAQLKNRIFFIKEDRATICVNVGFPLKMKFSYKSSSVCFASEFPRSDPHPEQSGTGKAGTAVYRGWGLWPLYSLFMKTEPISAAYWYYCCVTNSAHLPHGITSKKKVMWGTKHLKIKEVWFYFQICFTVSWPQQSKKKDPWFVNINGRKLRLSLFSNK